MSKPLFSPAITTLTASAALLITSGCDSITQSFSNCANLREDIIELSEKDRSANGYALVAIYDPTEVSRSEKELVCTGKAAWSDNDETGLIYKQYIDQEGDTMIQYEVD